jgi:hypothetical protein
LINDDGTVDKSIWVFLGCGVGTLVAAMTGSTPIIVGVESAAGVKEGGRTGLTSITIGTLFLISTCLAPLFGAVPPQATAPVLVLIGAMMMGESGKIEWENMSNAVPAFLTIVMMPFTYSITNGMVFGLVSSFLFYITTGGIFVDLKAVCCGKKELGEGSTSTGTGTDEESTSLVTGDVRAASPLRSSMKQDIKDHFGDVGPLSLSPQFMVSSADNAKINLEEESIRAALKSPPATVF